MPSVSLNADIQIGTTAASIIPLEASNTLMDTLPQWPPGTKGVDGTDGQPSVTLLEVPNTFKGSTTAAVI